MKKSPQLIDGNYFQNRRIMQKPQKTICRSISIHAKMPGAQSGDHLNNLLDSDRFLPTKNATIKNLRAAQCNFDDDGVDATTLRPRSTPSNKLLSLMAEVTSMTNAHLNTPLSYHMNKKYGSHINHQN